MQASKAIFIIFKPAQKYKKPNICKYFAKKCETTFWKTGGNVRKAESYSKLRTLYFNLLFT